MSGKGSGRRPTLISKHEEDLRWKLAQGKITFNEFEKRIKELRLEEKRAKDKERTYKYTRKYK